MSDKTKNIIRNIIIIVLAVWLAVDTFFLIILCQMAITEGKEPIIDPNIIDLQFRVSCLEDGTTYSDVLAEWESSRAAANASQTESDTSE